MMASGSSKQLGTIEIVQEIETMLKSIWRVKFAYVSHEINPISKIASANCQKVHSYNQK